MAEAFLSTIWYRVSELRPQLRAHVSVHRHRYRGQAWYVLHDHGTAKVHRFTPAAYMLICQMDGRISVDEAWRAIAETHDADAPSQDEVIKLLSQLHQNDLIQYNSAPDVNELLERYNKNARQIIKQNITNPVSFRIPLWDPDFFLTQTLPFVKPLLGWFGLLLWAVIVGIGITTAVIHWERFTSGITDQLFAAQNIIIMIVTYPLLKALHELAHGYLAKVRGAEVREMGIMFLVFFPVPYVDASAAAAFQNKWHRAAVGAGGIIIETFVAAIAIVIWTRAETGFLTSVAFNLATIGGLSTILVNGNPLLKFDGYYVMTDLIEIPNLANRANQFWGHLIQRYVFNAKHMREKSATWGERIWFVFYAPAAFTYRMVIMIGIAMFVAQKFFVIGVLIACWSVFDSIMKPVFKHVRHVITSPGLRKVRGRAYAWTFGGTGALIGAALLIPLPLYTDTEGVIWLPESAYVRAETSGFVVSVGPSSGAEVQAQTILINLVDPSVESRVETLRWQVEEQKRRLVAAEVEDRPLAIILRSELKENEAELERELERMMQMAIRAPETGSYEPVHGSAEQIGQYISEGDVIGYVVPKRPERIRMVVTQDDIGLVRERLKGAEIKVAGAMDISAPTKVLGAVPAGIGQLPSPALSANAGGRFQTDPSDQDSVRTLEPIFIYDLAVPPDLKHVPFGARVLVRVNHGHEPAAFQIFRRVRQVFLRQFNA